MIGFFFSYEACLADVERGVVSKPSRLCSCGAADIVFTDRSPPFPGIEEQIL